MKCSIIITVLAIAVSSFAADFTSVAEFGSNEIRGIAWGDYNGDGYPDLALANDGQNLVYENNGDGTFTEKTPFGFGASYAMAFADFDNDGDQDMAVGNYNGEQNKLFVNDGSGTFAEYDRFGAGSTYSIAWGDVNNDGYIDLVTGNFGGDNNLYLNNDGDGTFTENATPIGVGQTTSLAFADFDNDNDLDLAIGNLNNNQNWLYINDGTGSFTQTSEFGYYSTFSLAWGDYNNDGENDMMLGNYTSSVNRLYTNDGSGGFTGENQFGNYNTRIVAWGDADNDNFLDAAIGNCIMPNGSQSKLYVNDGVGDFDSENQFGTGPTFAIAFADFDRDGDLDLAEGALNEQSYLYVNNQDDDDYLVITLIGHYFDNGSGYSNRDGIGAKVYLYEVGYLGDVEHLIGYREIESNGGPCSQDSINAEFGTVGYSTVDVLVKWSGSDGSRIEEEWSNVSTGQYLTLNEGEGTPVAIDDDSNSPTSPRAYNLYTAYPNPSNGNATIKFALHETTDVNLSVYDIKGRKVSVIAEGEYAAGEHTAEVRELSSGLYLYSLITDNYRATKKMIIK